MNHPIMLITLLVCLIINCAGCWDQVELDKRAIIVAIGIDKAEKAGEFTLTLQSVITSRLTISMSNRGSDPGRAVRIVSTSGKTILEALKDYRQQTNNQPYLQENRLLIIGEDLARDGVGPMIDFFMRSPTSRTRAWVLVSRGKASDVLKWQSEVRRIPADFIDEMFRTQNTTTPMVTEDIHHYILKLSNPSLSPTTSGIEIIPEKGDQPPEVRIFGAAVFKKDKLAGWLDFQETRGLLWIMNKFGKGIIETSFVGKGEQSIALQITRSSTKIYPELNNGKINLKLKIAADGNLGEQSGGIKLTKKEVIQSLERKAAAEINKEVQAALNKCQQEFKSDVFGFGEEIERKFPRSWKKLQQKWAEEFPRLQVNVVADVKIKGTGIIMDPVNLK